MLPPRGARADVLSLEALEGVLEPESRAPELEPSAEPARGITSGVFENKQRDDHDPGDGLVDHVISLQPYYRGDEAHSDRAQLQIDDFSLALNNPFLASSLVPPPRKPPAVSRLLGVVGGLLLAVAGASTWLLLRNAPAPRAAAMRSGIAASPIATPSPVASEAKNEASTAAGEPAAIEARPGTERGVAPVAAPAVPVAKGPSPTTNAAASTSIAAPSLAAMAVAPAAAKRPSAVAPIAQAASSATEAVRADTASVTPVISGVEAASVPPADEGGALPETPARADIVAGFEQVRDDLVKCADGKHGVVDIDATIANSGRMAQALIYGAFKGTPEGSCIARAVRTARFPRFSQPSLKVDYPVSL